ncbi:unnamed protein product [Polarella glacialis]|uniref:Uncharacterized protein n=1 Tax=Polarella glacialis TaxID=89957 RepID=A0A813F4W9_POLGL|nr:unnamed protein product [Polarella glacialis]
MAAVHAMALCPAGRSKCSSQRRQALQACMLLATAACLLISSSAFVGPLPSSTARSLGPVGAVAAQPVTLSNVTSSSSGTIARSLGGVAMLCALSLLRPKRSPKRSFRVAALASSSASAFQHPAVFADTEKLLSPPPAAAPIAPTNVCLMMADMEMMMPIAVEVGPAPSCGLVRAAPALPAAAAAQPRMANSQTASTSNRASRARFVGGSRRSASSRSSSSSRGAAAARRAARRSTGSRLQPRPLQETVPASFDSSRLRLKIQIGLCSPATVANERGREARTTCANIGTCFNADARIQEKYLLEHSFIRTISSL